MHRSLFSSSVFHTNQAPTECYVDHPEWNNIDNLPLSVGSGPRWLRVGWVWLCPGGGERLDLGEEIIRSRMEETRVKAAERRWKKCSILHGCASWLKNENHIESKQTSFPLIPIFSNALFVPASQTPALLIPMFSNHEYVWPLRFFPISVFSSFLVFFISAFQTEALGSRDYS